MTVAAVTTWIVAARTAVPLATCVGCGHSLQSHWSAAFHIDACASGLRWLCDCRRLRLTAADARLVTAKMVEMALTVEYV